MSHLYIDGILTHGIDPRAMPLEESLERASGPLDCRRTIDLSGTVAEPPPQTSPDTRIPLLLADAANRGLRCKFIQPRRTNGTDWWVDLISYARNERHHGYGPSLGDALAAALAAPAVLGEGAYYDPHHEEPSPLRQEEVKVTRRGCK